MLAVAPQGNMETTTGLCAACGIPFDSQYFDESGVRKIADESGTEVVLARFELPAQYCGVLQYVSQFTDAFGGNFAVIATPTIEWKLLVNNHALFPYINLRHIVNPWGYGSYPVNLRLHEDSTIELVARRVIDDESLKDTTVVAPIKVVGGRLVGRFWYNASYGDVR
jgi:hypothetical protein